jgi:hypothetical protein
MSEGGMSDADEVNSELCPYCGQDTCEHHVASLDLTFRQVVGGALYEACDECLSRIMATLGGGNEDADVEAEAFERLEEVLEDLPGLHPVDSEFHGGPGQSSAMRHYWVEDPSTLPALAECVAAEEA